jgi:hypothetical protein
MFFCYFIVVFQPYIAPGSCVRLSHDRPRIERFADYLWTRCVSRFDGLHWGIEILTGTYRHTTLFCASPLSRGISGTFVPHSHMHLVFSRGY